MIKKLIFSITCIFLSQSASAVESLLLGEIEQLPINVRIVKTCGAWQADNRDGYYRLIVGDVYDGAGSEIYVQWITNATQDKKSELVNTLAFPELNNDHLQYSIQSADCKKVGKSTVITAKALFEHDENDQVHELSIRLIDIGKYQLSDKVRK
jgi:hypothetical protein